MALVPLPDDAQLDGQQQGPTLAPLPDHIGLDVPGTSAPWLPYAQQEPIHSTDGSGWYKLRKDGSHMSVSAPNNANGIAFKDIPQRLDDMGRSFADHASFGQANKLEAALSSITGDKSYDENLADEKAKSAAVGPVTKMAMGVLGLTASPVNKLIGWGAAKAIPEAAEGASKLAEVARRYGQYAMQGGATNALYQATMGDPEDAKKSAAATTGVGAMGMVAPPEGGPPPVMPEPAAPGALGTLGNAAANFGKGAILGPAGAAVVEGAPGVARTIASPILKRLQPEEAFFAKLAQASDRGNLTPEMLAAKDAKLGDSGMLANVGGQITDFARDIAQFPGRARQAAQSAFNLQRGSPLASSGGAVGRVEDALDSGLSSEGARSTVNALTEMRTRTSSPLWQALPMDEAPESKVFQVLGTNPEIKKGMRIGANTARNNANSNGESFDPGSFVKVNDDGKAVPTFAAWQGAKEGLDDILFSGGAHIVDPLTGKLTGYGRSVSQLRGTLLDEMKLHMPGYEDALSTWSGPTQSMRMVDLGQKIAKGDARVTSELMDAMTPNEQDFLRIGYADQMKYLASKTRNGTDVVKSLFGNQNEMRNAQMLFRSRDDFNQFRMDLARETKFQNSRQTILGGSPTATKLAGMDDAALDIGQTAAEGASHGGITGAVGNLAAKGWARLRAEPEAVRDVGSQYLFSTDPAKRAYALDQLRKIHASGNTIGAVPQELPRNLLNLAPMMIGP